MVFLPLYMTLVISLARMEELYIGSTRTSFFLVIFFLGIYFSWAPFLRLAPYFERLRWRFSTPVVSLAPRTMW